MTPEERSAGIGGSDKSLPRRMMQYRIRNGRPCLHCEAGHLVGTTNDCGPCAGTGFKPLSFDNAAKRGGFSRSSWQSWEEEGKTPTKIYREALLVFLQSSERKAHRANDRRL